MGKRFGNIVFTSCFSAWAVVFSLVFFFIPSSFALDLEFRKHSNQLSGVNLPHLSWAKEFRNIIIHDSFESNLVQMGWNSFRLPLDWSEFSAESGALDFSKIQKGMENLILLIERLKAVHQRTDSKIFLIIDFHQYKFSPLCGGVGIPKNAVSSKGLSVKDPNCVFKAFHKFWNNENGVQSGWVRFASAFLQKLPDLWAAEKDWLILGVEPFNEPQFGSKENVLTDSSFDTMMNLMKFSHSDEATRQVNHYLFPFYWKFLSALTNLAMKYSSNSDEYLKNLVIVFQPFLLDHLNFNLFSFLSINIDGNYKVFKKFRQHSLAQFSSWPNRWIAAPHHYLGAYDEGFNSFLPDFLKQKLVRYPNSLINSQDLRRRFETVKNRMADIGLPLFIGEWGTETKLETAQGKPGGYRKWIADSRNLINEYTAGHFWWRYFPDKTPKQSAFYLLSGFLENGTPRDYREQVLKCPPFSDLVPLVYGHCGGG